MDFNRKLLWNTRPTSSWITWASWPNTSLIPRELGKQTQFRTSRPGIDGFLGLLHRFLEIFGDARGQESGRAVDQHNIAMRARLSLKNCRCDGCIAGPIAPAQSFGCS